VAYCKKIGRASASLCYGRYFSDLPDDNTLYCPPKGGVCTRR
jgi:hypothetical protein